MYDNYGQKYILMYAWIYMIIYFIFILNLNGT